VSLQEQLFTDLPAQICTLCYPILMQQPVKERIGTLREEIAQISGANRLYWQGGKKMPGAAADQERRLERLQAIQEELKSLTDWKKL
jgi:hypothetical protein